MIYVDGTRRHPCRQTAICFYIVFVHLVYLLLESLFISRKAQVGWSLLRIQVTLPRSGAKCYSLWLFVESFGIDLMAYDWFFTMFLPLIWFLKFCVKMNDMTIYLDGFTVSHCHISHGIFETRSFPVWHRVIWPLVGIGHALCNSASLEGVLWFLLLYVYFGGYPPPTNPYKPSLSTVCGPGIPPMYSLYYFCIILL